MTGGCGLHHTPLLKLYGVPLFYPSRRLDNDLHHFFIQQRFPLLHRKYDGVMYLPAQ